MIIKKFWYSVVLVGDDKMMDSDGQLYDFEPTCYPCLFHGQSMIETTEAYRLAEKFKDSYDNIRAVHLETVMYIDR